MGKRYRSNMKGVIHGDGKGGVIRFVNHLYPPFGKPELEDETVIAAIEGSPKFGKTIKAVKNIGAPMVAPQPEHVDAELQHLQRAAAEMEKLGLNVNPKIQERIDEKLAAKAKDEKPELLPTKTFVKSAKKAELIEAIEKHGWADEIDLNSHNTALREFITKKIEESKK